MYEYLKIQALSNVWCSAEMDQQAVIVPARICRTNGVSGTCKVMLDTITLPTPVDEYHVYQIGKMPTPLFSMELTVTNTWQLLEDICNEDILQVNLYTNDGIEYPKSLAYAMLTPSDSMIIAVRNYPTLTDIRNEELYLRFYSNAFRASIRSDDISVFMRTHGKVITDDYDTAEIINLYNSYSGGAGDVRTYWNGFLTALPSIGSVKYGDTLELIYDAGVETVLEFPVKTLPTFTSKVDGVGKYLIHPNKDDISIDSIFYRDDIDVYLMANVDGVFKGVYVHHNLEHTLRMVTHNDYSVTVDSIEKHARALGTIPELCTLRMYMRNSGYERPTVHESNFIHELYKLPDDEMIDAMSSTVEATTTWHADNLEASMYTRIMRESSSNITGDMALEAFGYSATCEDLMDSPIRVYDGETITVPGGYVTDVLRIRQNFNANEIDVSYQPANVMIMNGDMYSGTVTHKLSSIESRDTVHEDVKLIDIPEWKGFRCYRAVKRSGLRVGDWVDVTESTDYSYVNGKFQWYLESELYFTAVVCGDFTTMQTFSFESTAGVLIPLVDTITMDGVDVPCAEELLYFNNYRMIEGIDYVKGSKGYMVVNKSLVNTVGTVKVTVVKAGMASNAPREEFGFVQYNTLSYNDRYDIHSGVLLEGVISGKAVAKEDLKFYEGPTGDMLTDDGSPYLLRYYRGPITDIPWNVAQGLRDISDDRMTTLSNYLHERIPEVRPDLPVTIPGLYQVFSPFIDAIVEAFGNGTLTVPDGRITDDEMEGIISSYLPLLEFEPSKTERYSTDFMVVHPTNNNDVIVVTPIQYVALQQIINKWLGGMTTLTDFVGVA